LAALKARPAGSDPPRIGKSSLEFNHRLSRSSSSSFSSSSSIFPAEFEDDDEDENEDE
jgi:hypothetical protein